MSDIADTHSGQVHHPGAATYLIIAVFLVILDGDGDHRLLRACAATGPGARC